MLRDRPAPLVPACGLPPALLCAPPTSIVDSSLQPRAGAYLFVFRSNNALGFEAFQALHAPRPARHGARRRTRVRYKSRACSRRHHASPGRNLVLSRRTSAHSITESGDVMFAGRRHGEGGGKARCRLRGPADARTGSVRVRLKRERRGRGGEGRDETARRRPGARRWSVGLSAASVPVVVIGVGVAEGVAAVAALVLTLAVPAVAIGVRSPGRSVAIIGDTAFTNWAQSMAEAHGREVHAIIKPERGAVGPFPARRRGARRRTSLCGDR